MSPTKMVRRGWSCASDEAGVIISSIVMAFLMLSWAYIPALGFPTTFRGGVSKTDFGFAVHLQTDETIDGEVSS